MKPRDLKYPFESQNWDIFIQDRIWHIPERYANYAQFTFPGWNDVRFFSQNQPICIEYCSGNGAWVTAKAQTNPHLNWVAIERKFTRARKIWSKIKNYSLTNLIAVCGEGYCVTHHYIPDCSVQDVYINFPDPWPKNRHAKNRLIQGPFATEILRILIMGGTLTLVTDDKMYSQNIINVLHRVPGFQSIYPDPYYVSDYPDYGSSYFEDLWRQKGKTIRYHAFRKIDTK